jgi:hypothetical protein
MTDLSDTENAAFVELLVDTEALTRHITGARETAMEPRESTLTGNSN